MAQAVEPRDVEDAWGIATSRPGGQLRSAVRGYFGWREVAEGPVSRWETPSGGVSLILSFGPMLRVSNASVAGVSEVSSFVVGMYDEVALTEHDGVGHGVQIDLTSAGAYALLGVPMHELSNRVVSAGEVEGLDAGRLVDRLLEAAEPERRFQILDEELGAAVVRGPHLTPEVAWIDRQLRCDPNARIGELQQEVGWSRPRLVERFRREIGVPPKTLGRIMRFRRAVDNLLAPSCERPLSVVAADCGYADQSHFNREFRSFAGRTPTEFLALERLG